MNRFPTFAAITRAVLLTALLGACGEAPPPPVEPPPPAPVVDAEPVASAEPAAPAAPSIQVPAAIAEVVAAADRSEADKALDAGRHPAELLAFFGVSTGMKVAELGAGSGYTAELLARVVGPKGKVYAQNSKFILERFAEAPWTERLEKPVMKNVVRVDREFDSPVPPDVKDLDGVLLVMFYHDTVWMEIDRAKMNAAIFAALKPGGFFAVVDHSAKEGSGVADVKTLHRIEEGVVRQEVEKAGFRLDKEASFLRNPDDSRDWNASPSAAGERRGESDRFVLRFVKPE